MLECLGHAFDAEVVCSARYRWILAHDEPPLAGYDQDLWVDRQRHGGTTPASCSRARGLRAANLELWGRSPEQERARVGHHAERGPECYDLTFRLLAGHDRFHLAQAGAGARRRDPATWGPAEVSAPPRSTRSKSGK